MDGCHPTFSNHLGYGWIEQGKQFQIKTTISRIGYGFFRSR
jgi:hypothetical protein